MTIRNATATPAMHGLSLGGEPSVEPEAIGEEASDESADVTGTRASGASGRPPRSQGPVVVRGGREAMLAELPTRADAEAQLRTLEPEALRALEALMPSLCSGDPMILLAALASEQHAEARAREGTSVSIEMDASARAAEDRAEASRRAERAARKASRLLGNAPKWLKKLVQAVVVAAAATATAMSGGVAAGLAIAGAVLIIAAEGIGKAAVALGMSPEHARYLQLGCQVAGAVMMAGAGFAGGASAVASAASTTRTSIETVRTVVRTVDTVLQIHDGVRELGASVASFRATNARVDVERAGLERDRANDALDGVLAAMRGTSSSLERTMDVVQEGIEAQARVRSAMIERLA